MAGSVVVVVMAAALWAVLPLCGWGAYDVEPFGTSCTLQWSTPDRAYITCVFGSCLVLPVVAMVGAYGSILRDTRAASRRLRKYGPHFQTSSGRSQQELRLIKMTMLMSGCFLLAWLPYSVLAMMAAYVPRVKVSGPVSTLPTLLAKTCHLTNPFIYFVLNSRLSRRLPRPCLRFWHRPMSTSQSRAPAEDSSTDNGCGARLWDNKDQRGSNKVEFQPMETFSGQSQLLGGGRGGHESGYGLLELGRLMYVDPCSGNGLKISHHCSEGSLKDVEHGNERDPNNVCHSNGYGLRNSSRGTEHGLNDVCYGSGRDLLKRGWRIRGIGQLWQQKTESGLMGTGGNEVLELDVHCNKMEMSDRRCSGFTETDSDGCEESFHPLPCEESESM